MKPHDEISCTPLPMTPDEVAERGWDAVDVVFVTGDAYVDHPSFAMALLGRHLQSHGYRVAILSQPDWRSCEAWRMFGRPRICFAVSAGNMDSMINHYTANRKVRNDDAYSPGGRIGRRPDRATLAYCQRSREAYRDVPVVTGSVEASLRRLAHYDYWSDKVRRSIIMDAKPDLLVFGMGEQPLLQIVRGLESGKSVAELRDLPGVAYRLGGNDTSVLVEEIEKRQSSAKSSERADTILLPSYEEVSSDPAAFARMTRIAHLETNPHNARRLVQLHGGEAVVVNRPCMPLPETAMDRLYGLPFTRRPHPSYGGEKIPAHEVVKDSIQIMRGCYGGCTFCSITAHEGRIITSRSRESILAEIGRMAADTKFHGTVSDIGGPTANMYRTGCTRPEVQKNCRRASCLHPKICKLLGTDHGPLLELMKLCRTQPGVKHVFVASGVRMDLANRNAAYIDELAAHHTGGHLKVAPEHTDPAVLQLMAKPPLAVFEEFARRFEKASSKAGRPQFLVPYFIAAHPGSDLPAMIDAALFLKRSGYRIEQVQEFLPGPFDIATCMYHTGIDPMSGKKVYVAKGQRERRMQKALLLFNKPENYALVREALEQAGREDLIGTGPDCLISSRRPRQAQTKADPRNTGRQKTGYRPHRKSKRPRR